MASKSSPPSHASVVAHRVHTTVRPVRLADDCQRKAQLRQPKGDATQPPEPALPAPPRPEIIRSGKVVGGKGPHAECPSWHRKQKRKESMRRYARPT